MTPKPVEWAKVVGCLNNDAFGVAVGDIPVGPFVDIRDVAERRAEAINKALSPLLARAAFAGEMAGWWKIVRDDFDCDGDAHKYGTLCRCCLAERLLTSYASLPKMPEQGKQKGENNA